MSGNKLRTAVLILVLAVMLIIGLTWWLFRTKPEKRPVPTTPEPTWYVMFSVKKQTATAYTESSWAPVSSSGKGYFLGAVAVHPRYPVNSGGSPRQPIIPYGTVLHLHQPVKIHGKPYSAVKVIDTGDINYRLWSNSPYWIDVYHGTTDYWNNVNANKFGTNEVDYFWVEKWK